MNIKSRLHKIEQAAGVNEKFCICPHTPKTEIIFRCDGADTVENPLSDDCKRCKKPVEKQSIIIDFVKAKKSDLMTDEQYAPTY